MFTDHCNRIGQKLGLDEVVVRNRGGKKLPKAAQWPHCVAPPDRYGGAYQRSGRKVTASTVTIPVGYQASAIGPKLVDGEAILDIGFDPASGDGPPIQILIEVDAAEEWPTSSWNTSTARTSSTKTTTTPTATERGTRVSTPLVKELNHENQDRSRRLLHLRPAGLRTRRRPGLHHLIAEESHCTEYTGPGVTITLWTDYTFTLDIEHTDDCPTHRAA